MGIFSRILGKPTDVGKYPVDVSMSAPLTVSDRTEPYKNPIIQSFSEPMSWTPKEDPETEEYRIRIRALEDALDAANLERNELQQRVTELQQELQDYKDVSRYYED